jgi:hypothetical protein
MLDERAHKQSCVFEVGNRDVLVAACTGTMVGRNGDSVV